MSMCIYYIECAYGESNAVNGITAINNKTFTSRKSLFVCVFVPFNFHFHGRNRVQKKGNKLKNTYLYQMINAKLK